ncbi:MAG: hypothetical protein WCR52_16120 [Bacteroidota bacterium]
MKLNGFITLFFLFFIGSSITAQSGFNFEVGMNMGMSKLYHNIRFDEEPKLVALYKTIMLTHPEGYPWSRFEEDFNLKTKSIMQPRFGFSGTLTYRDWPVAVYLEGMSSPSSYLKMTYGVTIALGKKFDLGRSDYFVTGYGGYKFVKDFGFGNQTILNAIGNKEIRGEVEQYFNPEKPLGQQKARMFTLRGGIGKTFGSDDQLSVGIEGYGELDLTDKIKRTARMTNIGLQAYARFFFELGFHRNDSFYPNPGGSRSK